MENGILTGAIALIIGLFVGYYVIGWWYRLSKRIRIQESQLFLLSKIAKANGVAVEDLNHALRYAYGETSDLYPNAENKPLVVKV